MILQGDTAMPVWGWAEAGEKVTVAFAGQTRTVTADEHGKWTVNLDPLSANAESRELTVVGKDSSVPAANSSPSDAK